MQRRSFVQASVLGATTTGLTSACSRTSGEANNPDVANAELRARLERLDREMEDVRCRPIDLGRAAKLAANDVQCREVDPLDTQLYRSSLRALLLTANIKDIPEADRAHPEVQARLDAHAAEADFAIAGMAHRLGNMPTDELARIQERLRSDPDMTRRILEMLDEAADQSDVPLGRRLRMRRLARVVLWRLRNQPTDKLLRECNDKIHQMAARLGPIAVKNPVANPRPEDVAYWQAQTLLVVNRYQAPGAAPDAAATTPPPAAAAEPPEVTAQRSAGNARRAKAEGLAGTDAGTAAAEFQAAGDLYAQAAALQVESDATRASRSELLDLSINMYLRAHALTGNPTPLRFARNTLNEHETAYRTTYGEAGKSLPEYARLQSHTIYVQEMLLRIPAPVQSRSEEHAEYLEDRRRTLMRAGGITAGVGLGLLLLGLGLFFGEVLFLTPLIVATFAGIALLTGLIILIVGAAMPRGA